MQPEIHSAQSNFLSLRRQDEKEGECHRQRGTDRSAVLDHSDPFRKGEALDPDAFYGIGDQESCTGRGKGIGIGCEVLEQGITGIALLVEGSLKQADTDRVGGAVTLLLL